MEKVRDYLYTYEGIGTDSVIYGDFVPQSPVNFALVKVPSQDGAKVRRFVSGSEVKEYTFSFMAKQNFSQINDATMTNFQNSKFFDDLEDWIEQNNKDKVYPDVNGAFKVEVLQTGFLFDLDDSGQYAAYQMTARLLYKIGGQ